MSLFFIVHGWILSGQALYIPCMRNRGEKIPSIKTAVKTEHHKAQEKA